MSKFMDSAKAFCDGNMLASLDGDVVLILADKSYQQGKQAIIDSLINQLDFFSGMKIISDDSNVTVSFRNAQDHLIKCYAKGNLIGKIVEFNPDDIRQRIKLVIEYDGTNFSGFQIQPNVRTVQKELMDILTVINNRPTGVTGASRTDALVHALEQTVHFDTKYDFSEEKWLTILNHALPKDIHVKTVKKVHPLFHSRFDVDRKEYQYIINLGEYSALKRNYEWTPGRKIDLDIIEKELFKLVGTFDFSSFCKGEKESTKRTIYEASMKVKNKHLYLTFIGNGFLHNMIRLIVGSLVEIASGQTDIDILAIIADKSRTYTQNLAFGGGLYLVKVIY